MSLLRAGLALCVCGCVASASAQTIYKSVGANGKVQYSDLPPATGTRFTTMQSGVVAAPKPSSATSTPTGPAKEPGKSGTAQADNSAITAQKLQQLRQVLGAVTEVMVWQQVVQQGEAVCAKVMPASDKRFAEAAAGWRQRNQSVVSQSERILESTGVSSDVRDTYHAALKTDVDKVFGPVRKASSERQVKWCGDSVQELKDGKLDVYNRGTLAQTLNAYPLK